MRFLLYRTRRFDPLTILWLALILLVAICVRVLSFSGYFGSDDIAYVEVARQMAAGVFQVGHYAGAPVFALRVGITAPVAMGFSAGVPQELVIVAMPFIFSILSVILAYFAGQAFFSRRAGLLAAAIMAILPLDARSASMLLPDLPAAFWAGAGVLFLRLASVSRKHFVRFALGVCCGIGFGLSWLCKEAIVYLIPFVAIYAGWLMRRDKRTVTLAMAIALAALAVPMTEAFLYHRWVGDWLYRFHETERNYEVARHWFFAEGSPSGWQRGGYAVALMARLFRDGPAAMLSHEFGMTTIAAVVAIGYAAQRKIRSFVLPGLWFLSLVVMFNFASSSMYSYRPLVLGSRYLYLFFFPALFLTAGLIDTLFESQEAGHEEMTRDRWFWGGIIALSVALICAWGLYRNVRTGPGSPVERATSLILGPGDSLYTDSRTARVLEFFWHYPGATGTHDFENLRVDQVRPGSFV